MQSTGSSCVYQSEIEEENKQQVPAPHSRRAVWTGLTVSQQTSVTMSVCVCVCVCLCALCLLKMHYSDLPYVDDGISLHVPVSTGNVF